MTRTIELRTEIPGARSRAILERKRRVVAKPLSVTLPVVIESGRGAALTDVDGNTFIDFAGGVGCLNVGHSHPRIVEAVQAQVEHFSHTDFTVVPYEVYVTLAERLTELAPFRGPAKAAFFNAGTEAIENAIKFARSYTKRPAVIAFEGAFHGRTLLALTMTSKTHPYKAGLGPFAPEVYRLPFAQDYRGPDSRSALATLERALVTTVAAESVAAIVIEPVQGEGGFVVAPRGFLAGLRRICDEHGIVLVVDEVQTGFGRTGKMFAIELVSDSRTKEPAPERASAVVEAAAERGLLLLKSGIYSNCIRVLLPLVITDAELDEGLGVWEDALQSALE